MFVDASRLSGTALDWVISLLFVGLGIAGLPLMRRIWRGDTQDRLARVLSPFSPHTRKVFASVIPLSFPGILVTGLLYTSILLGGASLGGISRLSLGVANALVPLFLLIVLLLFSILLFGRPRLLIPPYLREHHGFVGRSARLLLKSRS